jgi:hypothetical protein
MHLGATAFSVYNTSSAEQADHLFRNAGNRIVVTERQFLPRVLESRTPVIEHIVLVDGADGDTITLQDLARRRVPGFDFDAAWRAVQPDDVVTLIYTSGTTGRQAVQLTHGGVLFQTRGVAAMLGLQSGGQHLLPAECARRRQCLITTGVAMLRQRTSIPDTAGRPRAGGRAADGVRRVPRVWEKLKASKPPVSPTGATAGPSRRRCGEDRSTRPAGGSAAARLDRCNAYFAALGWSSMRAGHVGLSLRHRQSAGHVGSARSAGAPGVELRREDGELWCAARWS